MKRIVAKEFLLVIGCIVGVLLVALFGWVRNEWLTKRLVSVRNDQVECMTVLDSLQMRSVPTHHSFIELFDTTFIRTNYPLLLGSPPWVERLDPLSDFSRPFMACLGRILQAQDYMTESVSKRAVSVGMPYRTLEDLGKRVKVRYPGPYDGMVDAEVGRRVRARFPLAYEGIVDDNISQVKVSLEDEMRLKGAYLIDKNSKRKRSMEDLFRTDVQAPDGKVISFPEGMSEEEILRSMRKWYPPEVAEADLEKTEDLDAAVLLKGVQVYRDLSWTEFESAIDSAQGDSSMKSPGLLIAKLLMDVSAGSDELHSAHAHLAGRHVINCTVEELRYTLQRKPVPPTQDAADALAEQNATLDELRKEENDARSSIWSEAKQWAVVKWATIVLLVLVYPLRLMVLGTLWAIKVLRK